MNDTAKFWDRTAARYAKSPVGDEQTYQRKLAETQALFSPDMRVLEFGCGTGTTAIHHAPHVRHIDAIDISENMLDIARTRASEAGVENVTFTRGTLQDIDRDAEAYDAILGLNVMHLVPDRDDALAEVARLLKPGGVFVSSTVCVGASILRFIKLIAPVARALGLMPPLYYFTEETWANEVRAAGFDIETQWHHGRDGIAVFMIARRR